MKSIRFSVHLNVITCIINEMDVWFYKIVLFLPNKFIDQTLTVISGSAIITFKNIMIMCCIV